MTRVIAHAVRIRLPARDHIAADLVLPEDRRGIVVFAHGSGSSRHSSRNRHVASSLRALGFGTLLADLLTPEEEAIDRRTRHLRFDVSMLADRLAVIGAWLRQEPDTQALASGYFGASTGAAAALIAAARHPVGLAAIVSRGGRPDLAGADLGRVRVPTMLIVGGDDHQVLELNREAQRQLVTKNELTVVPGATHLFEEPGALDAVAELAGDWFGRHLSAAPSAVRRR